MLEIGHNLAKIWSTMLTHLSKKICLRKIYAIIMDKFAFFKTTLDNFALNQILGETPIICQYDHQPLDTSMGNIPEEKQRNYKT